MKVKNNKQTALLIVLLMLFGIVMLYIFQKPHIIIDESKLENLLNKHFDEVIEGIQIKNKILKSGRNYIKNHCPEFEPLFKKLKIFYLLEVNKFPDKKEDLNKVLKQMDGLFRKKQMDMVMWSTFHNQLNYLFSDTKHSNYYAKVKSGDVGLFSDFYKKILKNWGNLKLTMRNKKYIEKLIKHLGIVHLIYSSDGKIGVRALNYAYINKFAISAMTTNHNNEMPPIYTYNDWDYYQRLVTPTAITSHYFDNFTLFLSSLWGRNKNIDLAIQIYEAIEKQPSLIDRARDHVAFFILLNKLVPETRFFSYYANTFKELSDSSQQKTRYRYLGPKTNNEISYFKTLAMNAISNYNKAFNKQYREIRALNVVKISPLIYEVSGKIEIDRKTTKEVIPMPLVTIKKEEQFLKITFKDQKGKIHSSYKLGLKYTGLNYYLINLLKIIGINIPNNISHRESYNIIYNFLEDFEKKYVPIIDRKRTLKH